METKPDKKEHILDTAERIFAEFGYEGASTRLLAKEAGVNMAMLNYYFGSKDGLLQAVFERRSASTRQALQEVIKTNGPAWEKLFAVVDLYLEKVLTNKRFHRLIHREISLLQRTELANSILDALFRNVNSFKEIIEQGIAEGTFREVDVELTIASIFGTKYYLINSREIASRLLQMDISDPQILENELKPRVKKHLHDLLKAHLSKHDTKF